MSGYYDERCVTEVRRWQRVPDPGQDITLRTVRCGVPPPFPGLSL